ncbi:hypothetical protein ACOME3_002176 [Neoechinorhynchus agilis]
MTCSKLVIPTSSRLYIRTTRMDICMIRLFLTVLATIMAGVYFAVLVNDRETPPTVAVAALMSYLMASSISLVFSLICLPKEKLPWIYLVLGCLIIETSICIWLPLQPDWNKSVNVIHFVGSAIIALTIVHVLEISLAIAAHVRSSKRPTETHIIEGTDFIVTHV